MSTEIYVIVWDLEMRGPLAIRRAKNMRYARKVAEEMYEQYKGSPRISYFREVDADLSALHKNDPFLPADGWEST